MEMTDEQIERYSRHIILKEVGAKGQKKLLKGKVLIIGAGGLGAPAAMYLAAYNSRCRKSKGQIGKRDNECHESGRYSQYIPHVRGFCEYQRTDPGL